MRPVIAPGIQDAVHGACVSCPRYASAGRHFCPLPVLPRGEGDHDDACPFVRHPSRGLVLALLLRQTPGASACAVTGWTRPPPRHREEVASAPRPPLPQCEDVPMPVPARELHRLAHHHRVPPCDPPQQQRLAVGACGQIASGAVYGEAQQRHPLVIPVREALLARGDRGRARLVTAHPRCGGAVDRGAVGGVEAVQGGVDGGRQAGVGDGNGPDRAVPPPPGP